VLTAFTYILGDLTPRNMFSYSDDENKSEFSAWGELLREMPGQAIEVSFGFLEELPTSNISHLSSWRIRQLRIQSLRLIAEAHLRHLAHHAI
jgi:hypothetical protein